MLVCAAVLCARTAAAECTGAYAEDLSSLSPKAREAERHAPRYVYAVRTTATYECVAYGAGGDLQKTRSTQTAHGTAFGYRYDGGDTLLLTNEHVAEWPELQNGCKRTGETLRIVDSDHDDYAADDIPLVRVVTDQALDVAVLRAHTHLDILPWKIGTSSALTARTAVEVRGFPLGEFQAINVGKVISPNEHDDYGDWDHDDFVIDALLTSGGSGSPVLAVSCKTGELELVGIFHAHYSAANALNVVLGVDQLRTVMQTLEKPKHAPAEAAIALDGAARTKLVDAVRGSVDPPYFPLGPLVATANVRPDGTLVWTIFPSDFPRVTRPLLVIEDTAGEEGFGTLGRVFVGLRAYDDRDADAQALIVRTLDAVRRDAIMALELRAAPTPASREAHEAAARHRKAYDRMIDGQRDLASSLDELTARVHPATTPVALDQLLH